MLEPFFVTASLEIVDFSNAPSEWLVSVVRGDVTVMDGGSLQFQQHFAALILMERLGINATQPN